MIIFYYYFLHFMHYVYFYALKIIFLSFTTNQLDIILKI